MHYRPARGGGRHALSARGRREPMQARCHAARAPSRVATRRTPTERGSRGPSTWSRSASSTTPTPGGRCRCHVLPVPCRSANVRGGSSGQPGQGERRSPRPTCASTATRWPRTPTTVTPLIFRERIWVGSGAGNAMRAYVPGSRPYCSESAPGSEADPRSNPDLGRVSPIGKTSS
jgi:hypothetical protein